MTVVSTSLLAFSCHYIWPVPFQQDVTHSLTQPKGPFQPQEHETSSESSINQTSPAVCRSNGEAARQKANVDQSYRICCHSANLLHGFKVTTRLSETSHVEFVILQQQLRTLILNRKTDNTSDMQRHGEIFICR